MIGRHTRIQCGFMFFLAGVVPVFAADEIGLGTVDGQFPSIVRTAGMDVHYDIGAAGWQDIDRLELWYAAGIDGPWRLYDFDRDRVSPIEFIAPGEGLHRLLIVAVDRWSRRSCGGYADDTNVPDRAVPCHLAVFIDHTPPQLYLHSPRQGMVDYTDEGLLIRWEAFDPHLVGNPVRLAYRSAGDDRWFPIGSAQPAGGQYRWVLPEADISSKSIIVRVSVSDSTGNSDIQYSSLIDVSSLVSAEVAVPALPSDRLEIDRLAIPAVKSGNLADPPVSLQVPTPEPLLGDLDRDEAVKCFRQGNIHRQRLEWSRAAKFYEQALEHDSSMLEARVNYANVLQRLCRFETARDQYELCLQEDSSYGYALFGLAQTEFSLGQYEQSEIALKKLLRLDPEDWYAWLLYGDVCERQGNIPVALNSWHSVHSAAAGELPELLELAERRIVRYRP